MILLMLAVAYALTPLLACSALHCSCLGALVCLNDNWLNNISPQNNDGCLSKLQGMTCIQRNGDENLPFDVCGGE